VLFWGAGWAVAKHGMVQFEKRERVLADAASGFMADATRVDSFVGTL
jgi:hypothetical protein